MSHTLSLQPPWLRFAWADLGQREIAGRVSNPRIADYIRRVGHPEVADDETAWCAAFVGACLDRAGIDGTGSLMARSYVAWGEPAEADCIGAVAVLSRGRDPALGHVGFLVGATDDGVYLLGGNQSDAVTVARFDRSRLICLRRPPGTLTKPGATAALPEIGPDAPAGFGWSLARILEFEGGWTDDRFDPGGPTNKGITLAVFAEARGEAVTSDTIERLKLELRSIPDSLVERLYHERYWLKARCPDLPRALAHFHFDAAVNQGVGGAARMLQEALGVETDGEIGPLTLGAVVAKPIPELLDRYAAIRRRRYRGLQHFWRFGRGWLTRVDKALEQARSLHRPEVHPATPSAPDPVRSTFSEEGHRPMPEAQSTGASPPTPGKWWGQSLTVWGALLTAATTVAPVVFSAFGLEVSADLAERLGRDAVAVVQAIGGLAGTVMTILGRARADTPLQRRPLAVRI
ncbi:MAG: TIGR02594 family protein [Hyphomicrobiaceae bacterium]|nr:TIGR02594 family protein [Hyphomicrobiaceae bacterium]